MTITIEINRAGWSTSARLRRLPPLLLVVALVLAGPVLASDRFSDVPNSNDHHDNISAIADAGITLGCNAEGTQYCPDLVVTRDQMASFIARTAGLGANPPVANADELDGLDSTAFLPAADYTVMQHGPWLASGGGSDVTITYSTTWNHVASDSAGPGIVQLALDGPASVGGTGYGFQSARICFTTSPNVTIDRTLVEQTTDTSVVNLVNDLTDRPMGSSACYTVTDPTPTLAAGGTTLLLDLEYAAVATAALKAVTTTWTPVSP